MQDYLTAELKEYEMQLQDMVKENENAQGLGELTEVELLQVKKIYRRLVKKIHPDINRDASSQTYRNSGKFEEDSQDGILFR